MGLAPRQQPPGSYKVHWPVRASSGPRNRMEERIRSMSARGISSRAQALGVHPDAVPRAIHPATQMLQNFRRSRHIGQPGAVM